MKRVDLIRAIEELGCILVRHILAMLSNPPE